MEAMSSMALLDLGRDTEAHNYTNIILDLFISVCGVLYSWEWGWLFVEKARTIGLPVLELLERYWLHQGFLHERSCLILSL